MVTPSCVRTTVERVGRSGMMIRCAALVGAATTLVLHSTPLSAQIPSLQATASVGVAIPSDDYQSACDASSIALSVEVQGRGRWFPQVSLDYFTGSGGADVACIPVLPSVGTGVGGLRLDGATRLGVGAGGRIGGNRLLLEGALLAGLISGRRGFDGATDSDSRRGLPHVGVQAAVVLFRYAELSAAVNWTRLSLDVTPAAGGASSRQTSWSPMTTLQLGVRVPVGKP